MIAGTPRRRALLLGALALALARPAAAEHPALVFMREVARDMLNAHRQGTVASFRAALQRHADLAGIADYSLGQYRPKLPAGQKSRYYAGVLTFMARYFADQSRNYSINKYEIGEAASDGDDVVIDSKVFLASGDTYTVVWRLSPKRGGGYKVTDAKILGFSLVYLQRGLFTSYISKRGGDVAQLVTALNR